MPTGARHGGPSESKILANSRDRGAVVNLDGDIIIAPLQASYVLTLPHNSTSFDSRLPAAVISLCPLRRVLWSKAIAAGASTSPVGR